MLACLFAHLDAVMKTTVMFLILLAATGCASNYPGWEQVKIETSIIGQPCESRPVTQTCKGPDQQDCENWHRKRATMVSANTVVLDDKLGYRNARYFECRPGLPPYAAIKFNPATYPSGDNHVTGQAFRTQRGGGVITCAGRPVFLMPNDPYFSADAGRDFIEPLIEPEKYTKQSVCDAAGNFEFDHVGDGQWIIRTQVSWETPQFHRMGRYSFFDMTMQGGMIDRVVTVRSGEKNRFIVAD